MEELFKLLRNLTKVRTKSLVEETFDEDQIKIITKFVKLRENRAKRNELDRHNAFLPRTYYRKRIQVLEDEYEKLTNKTPDKEIGVTLQIRKA